ncbi:hypothetical protein OAO87_03090 [bacterium]|nr:hypothetical protein [bacterium]
MRSISLWTEDGAANNIKSSKLLGVPYETCGPHQSCAAKVESWLQTLAHAVGLRTYGSVPSSLEPRRCRVPT